MQRFAKWSIAATVSWVIFFVILFTGIVKKTSVFREYACEVRDFYVDPRFECYKRCSVLDSKEPSENLESSYENLESSYDYLSADDAAELMADLEEANVPVSDKDVIDIIDYMKNGDKSHENDPDCDELERDTLDFYSPHLCLHARFGFEDPLCPPENAPCYTGKKWRRKCGLSCPLAYNVTVSLEVDHIGSVVKWRDLGANRKRYVSYRDEYKSGRKLSCQVIKDVTGNHDVLFVDERLSHEATQWWKWSLFSGSLLLALFTTTAAVISSYIRFREQDRTGYGAINTVNPDGDG